VGLGDAFDDCEAEAHAYVVGAYAFPVPRRKNGSTSGRGDQLWVDVLTGVLDAERNTLWMGRWS